MVHELIGIENNLVDLSKCPSLKKEPDAKVCVILLLIVSLIGSLASSSIPRARCIFQGEYVQQFW